MKFVAEFARQVFALSERLEFDGRELVLLQLVQQPPKFLRKAGAACAPAKELQLTGMTEQ